MAETPLKQLLKTQTMEGELYEVHSDNNLTCYACGHRCLIKDGRDGICRVRFNKGGKLYVPANYTAGVQCDPTEKKPFFHVFPGSLAVTFGMLGCDFHCAYCQNWVTSQALRDPKAVAPPQEVRHGSAGAHEPALLVPPPVPAGDPLLPPACAAARVWVGRW